ncbi:PREDICTED: uncharacterized protein LOC109126395 [Camelina sativa]|uniref:Uncharacterized protein LOC109126395 n=1 Tax=Camelina sativa TaxID=90675 RepID=A0ABM1QFC8_CAMSA|nr:PREDICTED: uncharacterized protein LOC109126395 [Camelina sativa]
MTFFIEDTSLIISHLLYKTAVIIAVLRWIFACIIRYRSRSSPSPRSSSPSVSSQTIKESLAVTAFRDTVERSPSASISDTCAVCLGDLEDDDEIRELRNFAKYSNAFETNLRRINNYKKIGEKNVAY